MELIITSSLICAQKGRITLPLYASMAADSELSEFKLD